jgi:hypothetical protein
MVLHFARKSNQRRIAPRRFTDTVDGCTNQSANVSSVFAYGQAKEKINIKIASSCPPAIIQREQKLVHSNIVDWSLRNRRKRTIPNFNGASGH